MKKPYEVVYVYQNSRKTYGETVYAYTKDEAVRVHGRTPGEVIVDVRECAR